MEPPTPNKLLRPAVLALALAAAPGFAIAEPVTLKLAYFSSDRTTTYLAAIEPFVAAVNADAAGTVRIEAMTSGVLGKNPTKQLQLVLNGTADIAWIVPGYTPERFPDNEVIELPGLFQTSREATQVFTRLVARGALSGYQDLFVIGAFATEPESIHVRPDVASLDDLKDKRIRSNNLMQAAGLAKLGMVPAQISINKAATAISGGEIDGAAVPPTPVVEFGIGRVAPQHYMLGVGSAPLAVVMKRETLERLPREAQEVIRKFSGQWTAERYVAAYEKKNEEVLEKLKSDPKHRVVFPSPHDCARAEAAFEAVRNEWTGEALRNRQLLAQAEAELAKIRSGQTTGYLCNSSPESL